MAWEAVKYVSSALSLVAFCVAAIFYLAKAAIRRTEGLIRAAPEKDRGPLIDGVLGPRVDTAGLTKEQRYSLALRLIEERANRTKTWMVLLFCTAILIAGVSVFSMISAPLPAKKSSEDSGNASVKVFVVDSKGQSISGYVLRRAPFKDVRDPKYFDGLGAISATGLDVKLKEGSCYLYAHAAGLDTEAVLVSVINGIAEPHVVRLKGFE